MDNSKLISRSLLHALGVLAYVSIVAWIMTNGDRLFGRMEDTIFGPMAFLLLFVLSATIVGSLVLAKPAMLYLAGQKEEAIKFFTYTVGWLVGITVLLIALLATPA